MEDQKKINYSPNYSPSPQYSNYQMHSQLPGLYQDLYNFRLDSDSDSISSSISSESSSQMDDYQIMDMLPTLGSSVIQEIVILSLQSFGLQRFLNLILENTFASIDRDEINSEVIDNFFSVIKQRNEFQVELERFIDKEKHENLAISKNEYFDYHWTERFSNTLHNTSSVVNLEKDFNSTVEIISRIIILERNLPNYLKSIKQSDIGGKAGGDK